MWFVVPFLVVRCAFCLRVFMYFSFSALAALFSPFTFSNQELEQFNRFSGSRWTKNKDRKIPANTKAKIETSNVTWIPFLFTSHNVIVCKSNFQNVWSTKISENKKAKINQILITCFSYFDLPHKKKSANHRPTDTETEKDTFELCVPGNEQIEDLKKMLMFFFFWRNKKYRMKSLKIQLK